MIFEIPLKPLKPLKPWDKPGLDGPPEISPEYPWKCGGALLKNPDENLCLSCRMFINSGFTLMKFCLRRFGSVEVCPAYV